MKGKPGTRTCRTCGFEGPASEFPYARSSLAKTRARGKVCRACRHRRASREYWWRTHGRRCPRCNELRPCPQEISYGPRPVCKACQCAGHTKATARRRQDPVVREREVEAMRQWRRDHPDEARERQRRYRERVLSDPERAQEWREHNRIYHRIWRERQGRASSRINRTEGGWTPLPNGSHKGPLLDAGPLRDFLLAEFSDEPVYTLARRLGVDDSGLGRIVAGRYRYVSLYVADQILVRAGAPHLLGLLYPEEAA